MKRLILLITMAVSLQLNAQQLVMLKGKVVDENGLAISFAHVQYSNLAFTVTDTSGQFAITIADKQLGDTLKVSSLGYITYRIAMQKHTSSENLVITMLLETFNINGVTISNNKAHSHWLKTLDKLQANLPSIAYTYPALFRQVHQENGAYVRLIEAGIMVYDVAATYKSDILQERFKIEQTRRSNVLERNGDAHGDHLVDMFLENSLRYPTGTVMDPKVLSQFEFSYDDSHCTNCGDSLELLKYHYENGSDPKLLDGKIWLFKGSMKLFAIEENATHNPKYFERGISLGGGDNHWMFKASKKTMRFKYTDGKIYLSELQFEYLHHIQDRTVGIVRYEVTETFNLYCDAPTLHPYGFLPDRSYTRSGNLYSRKYDYQESFWQQYPLAISNPLPKDVANTFSSKVPLTEQFRRNGE